MIAALARVPAARFTRRWRAWVPALAWCALGVALAATARAQGSPNGADHVLVGAFGALVVPLVAYSIVGGMLGGRSLAGSTAPIVAFGGSRAASAAATVVLAAATTAALAAVLGAIVAAVAHGIDDPPLARDAIVSAYVGALGGAAYAAYFAVGASFGRRGGGRTVFLVLDWLLGGAGALGAIAPRAHLRSLLGGAACAGLSERQSALWLAAIAVVFTAAAIRRTERS